MAFGNAALPTRKYVYGARETVAGRSDDQGKRLKFPGHQDAIDQLWKAHRLQNDVVKIERDRREEANRIIHDKFPDLAQLLIDAEALDRDLDTMRAELARRNSAAGSKTANRDYAAEIRARATARKSAWSAHKVRKDAAYADPTVRAALGLCDERFALAKKNARTAAVADGLYWATSLIVMQRVKRSGPPPKFKRWAGEGLIAVQFQRKPDTDSPKVAVLDRHGNPKIHPRSGKAATRHEEGSSLRTGDIWLRNTTCWIESEGKPNKEYVIVHFRVGSTDDGSPIWCDIQVRLDRPLPEGAEIKWAHLSRRKVGTYCNWEVQFDVAMSDAGWAIHDGIVDRQRNREWATEATVAVALGWRNIDNEIRVGYWVGDDGQEGAIVIPRDRLTRWLECDSLQGFRDTAFDANKEALRLWLQQQIGLPQVWKDRTASLRQWRSPARLASLVIWWRQNRLPNDGAILRQMEGELVPPPTPNGRDSYNGGRLQDKHLFDWQENRRAKCRHWRKWYYREVALALKRQYRNIVVAEIDWHAIAENPAPEEMADDVNKRYRGIAACASLRDQLTECMTEVVVSAVRITVTCYACGATMVAPGRGQWVVCEPCGGDRMDRAMNAAKNLLQRGLGAAGASVPARVL